MKVVLSLTFLIKKGLHTKIEIRLSFFILVDD